MIKEIYGKKIGMTQIFDGEGNLIASTLIEVEPAYILEKVEYPGKDRARIGCFKLEGKKTSKVKKPIEGYFRKLSTSLYKLIREVEIEKDADFSFGTKDAENTVTETSVIPDETNKIEVKETDSADVKGDVQTQESSQHDKTATEKESNRKDPREVGVEIFKDGDVVDIQAKTKGRGFAGGMKRHGWSGQPASHGSTTHRRIGSVGASAYPSKIIKGINMPGHMGNSYRTIKNLKILKVDKENNLLFVQGSIPGARGVVVKLRKID